MCACMYVCTCTYYLNNFIDFFSAPKSEEPAYSQTLSQKKVRQVQAYSQMILINILANFRFSPSNIRKQFEEVHGSTGSSRDLIHHSQRLDASNQHNSPQDTMSSHNTPLTKSKTLDITVPGTVSPNVVTPWEDETLDSVIALSS